MNISSTRRAQSARTQGAAQAAPINLEPRLDAFRPREVEFVAAVPVAPRPAPPAPSQPRKFVPQPAPFACAPSKDPKARGRLDIGADFYRGALAWGLPVGGTWHFADGGIFEQRRDMEHLVLECGSHYFGETDDDMAHGEGTIRWFSSDTYTGTFSDGLPSGPGVWRFPDGRSFELPEGAAVDCYDSGDEAGSVIYGTTRDDAWHGLGVMQRYDGGAYQSTYFGEFTEGCSTGVGSIYYASGSIYHGDVVGESREGRGVLLGTWGSLDGHWQNEEFHGEGVAVIVGLENRIITTTGRFEMGHCVWGEQSCEGFPTWIGPFKTVGDRNVPHGFGRSINPDTGLEIRAEYENGRFIPPGWRELNGG